MVLSKQFFNCFVEYIFMLSEFIFVVLAYLLFLSYFL